ncbi:NADH:ubiquinone oxidoreductase [Roseovarius nubinhibens]|uniref:NADH:ubiquinone oxidoreductase n=1 Tax=Roseovarius nubinhibens TaxID=314263 RepID=UPI001C08DC58|nr:NADH:ubiquinone oxidoreductase [Roseovarius nubinhibens]MBU3000742.1 NADH:ubiquinone oxidoreductase [Roseovarius nubinhibens]
MTNGSDTSNCTFMCWLGAGLFGLVVSYFAWPGVGLFLMLVIALGIAVLTGFVLTQLFCRAAPEAPRAASAEPVKSEPVSRAAESEAAAGAALAAAPAAAATVPETDSVTETVTPEPAAASKPKPKPKPEAASEDDVVVVEKVAAGDTGQKPATLEAPRAGGADDLKRIKGVGPKLEDLLHGMGYYHFDQIAQWGAAEVAWVDQNLKGFKGRVSRDNWVAQAKTLAAETGNG